jgi:hypothetical protein
VKRMPYYGECVERTARSPDGGDYNTSWPTGSPRDIDYLQLHVKIQFESPSHWNTVVSLIYFQRTPCYHTWRYLDRSQPETE